MRAPRLDSLAYSAVLVVLLVIVSVAGAQADRAEARAASEASSERALALQDRAEHGVEPRSGATRAPN